jgi:DnaJ-like protein
MRDHYQVLGVLPGAPDEEVKRAFRRLAKELHPDLRPNDVDAGRAFRVVATAYETLSDPRSRRAYDAAVMGQHRSVGRRRLRARVATTVTAFALTVCSVSAAVLWQGFVEALLPAPNGSRATLGREAGAAPDRAEPVAFLPQDGPSQVPVESVGPQASKSAGVSAEPVALAPAPDRPSAGDLGAPPSPGTEPPGSIPPASPGLANSDDVVRPPDGAGKSLPEATESLDAVPPGDDGRSEAVRPPRQARTWASYRSADFGFALQYPADVFVLDLSPSGEARSLVSRDGRARLVISAMSADDTTLPAHRRSLLEGAYKGAAFDYTPQRSNWFVLSGTLGSEMFYERVTFSCDGRAVHGWKLVYPLAERTLYDRIVEEVHRRYRHGNRPGGRCGETSAAQPSRTDDKAVASQ